MIGRTAEGFIAVEPPKSPRELEWTALERLGGMLAKDAAPTSAAALVPIERIARHIVILRDEKVMLDSDLAESYGVETRSINQAVQRNIDRFPSDFMFQVNEEEADRLKSQSVISNVGRGGSRYRPYAFTEQGVAMLSSVLRSERAVQVNVAIMRAFVAMRKLIGSHAQLERKIAELESKYDGQFQAVFAAIGDLMSDDDVRRRKSPIGFLTEAGIKTKKPPKRKAR